MDQDMDNTESENRETRTWTDERINRLKELREQELSAREIGKDLGISRNAVIGKLHRLGLSPISQPPAPSVPRKPRREGPREDFLTARLNNTKPPPAPAPEPAQIEESKTPLVDSDIPLAQRRTFMQLRGQHCKWPIGDPQRADFLFCGGLRLERLPYCAAHSRIAYRSHGATERN